VGLNKLIFILINLVAPKPMVALTFDDGSCTLHSARVRRVLAAYNVKATFFPDWEVVGKRCERVIRRGQEEGHEYGIRGWTQRNINRLPRGKVVSELLRSYRRHRGTLGGRRAVFYRPGSGVLMTKATGAVFLAGWPKTEPLPIEMTWTLDTRDIDLWIARAPKAKAIKKIERRLSWLYYTKNDHVVLMHDNLPWAPIAIRAFLADRKSRRVMYVTMTEFVIRGLLKAVLKGIYQNERPIRLPKQKGCSTGHHQEVPRRH
jgi:peptidoglycan/xylan/chitin deacetylase (PgdA/CDA1 family)